MRIVTLTQAQVTYFEGYGLLGFLDVEQDSRERKYVFKLPTTANPTPPGWSTIERLTGVTAQQIIDSYDESGETNTAASAAVLELISRYRGEKFLATEVPNGDGISNALDLTLLDVGAATPVLTTAQTDVVLEPAAAPTRYVMPVHIMREVPSPGEGPSGIRILFGSVEAPEASLLIAAPDATDRSPPDWWFVATFTGIASERVANGWNQRGNEPLDDAIRLLGTVIAGHAAPLLPDGNVDLDLWRRQLVRKRLACNTKPFVFLGRPDHNSLHTRKIFRDCTYDYLFRANVDPGNSFGAPALIVSVDGRVKLLHLDDDDMLQVILNRYIRFATSGRPPRPRNPPKALLTDLIRLPDTSVPPLKGIVRIPTVREDGSIISTAGYDVQSQLWYAPEFQLEAIPDRPTTRDLQEAKALILTPFAEFPFVSEADRAGTLACLFEQILLPMISGPRPFFIFDAPEHGQGTGKCAKTDSLVLTDSGLLTLAELQPRPADPDTIIPFEIPVTTHRDTTESTSHFYVGGVQPTRRITTRRGFVIEGTHVHPVRCATVRGAAWRPTSEVQVGDYVAVHVAHHAGAKADCIDEDCAWLLGALIADGSLGGLDAESAAPVTYTKNDAGLRERVVALIPKYLGCSVSVIEPSPTIRAWTVRLNQKAQARERSQALDLAASKSNAKRIPRSVRGSSSKIWSAFLRGLFDGDGHVDKTGLEWTTASEQLASEVQIMLAALGVWAARKPKQVQLASWTEPRTYWRLTVQGQDLDVYAHVVGFTHEAKAARLAKRVADTRKRNTNVDVVPFAGELIAEVYAQRTRTEQERSSWKREIAGKNMPSRGRLAAWLAAEQDSEARRQLLEMTADHVRWDRVEVIEEHHAEVADLSVPGSTSFVANGVQVHNSLIAKTIQTIITGYKQPFTTALGKREEEIEKRITGLLRDAKPFIIVDNLSGAITSDSLAQLATSERWQARLLNTNEVPIYPQIATWVFTLNAAHMSRDIARRAVLIQLDTKLAVAWERSNFKIKDVHHWARTRRAAIIRACLMLTRAWVLDGRPADPTVVRGSFESWCEVIGGVLHHAGFDGLAQALRATGDRDASVEDHRVLMQAWAAKFGLEQPVPAYSIGLLATEYGLYTDKMPKRANNMAVGRAMSQILWGGLIGQCIDGRRIDVSPKVLNGYTGYTLVAATTSTPIPEKPRTRAASAPS